MSYLDTVKQVYAEVSATPDTSLCCTLAPSLRMPDLVVPKGMRERNYGCGTTVNPSELVGRERVLYVGVGAGMEALQMAYFIRKSGGVVAVDAVPDMLSTAKRLLQEAAALNPWFQPDYVDLREGDALALPASAESVDVAAQNCLFNVFEGADFERALAEVHRVLRPGGALLLSDPVSSRPIPARLAADPVLRARCLSGAIPLDDYLAALVGAGFGTIEVRSRRPYRVLDRRRYELDDDLMLESVEVIARRDAVPADGPCIFTGRTVTYVGDDPHFDDGQGHVVPRDQPLGICDKTAEALAALGRNDLFITPSNWHYPGDGCC